MRIAQVAPVGTTVGPRALGSIESMVWLLAHELDRMGHEVTVFAASGSEAPAELVTTLPGTYALGGSPPNWYMCEWINVSRAVEESDRFDVMHLHAYLWSIPLTPLAECPMVHTTHLIPHEDEARLRELYPEARVTAVSNEQWRGFPELPPDAVVPHGLDLRRHTFRADPDDYLCYLGRFTAGKGPLDAIAIARELGMRLVMAGPRDEHFDQIAPLVDGRNVEYVGFVDPMERDALLGGARALLYPIRAPEPFGLVPIQAMLSGTPVAATALGAVPELVEEGVTGAIESDPARLADAVGRCLKLDRRGVHERARERFSAERMAAGYAELYEQIVEEVACPS